MRKLYPIMLISLALTSCSVHELVATFGDTIAVTTDANSALVEYCPDNTCEVFELQAPSAALPLQDFAFAYLLGVSEYMYLDSFHADTESLATQSVLSRYRNDCPQPDTRLAARCIVGHLARKYPIRAAFVRYDEGERNEVPISLADFRSGT